jgi:uroporphyrinogen-III synthase
MDHLSGVRIAVTRAAAQARELAVPLESAGATVHVCPLIKIEPRAYDEEMRGVLNALDEFAWIVITSVNGVELLMRALSSAGRTPRDLAGKRIACVGPATATALQRYQLRPEIMPDAYVGEAIPAAMTRAGLAPESKVLLARAGGGGAALPALLRGQGLEVVDLELYRSILDPEGATRLKALVRTDKLDLVTFTSGSAATYFVQTIGTSMKAAVAVIGPSTAQAARAQGLRVDVVAEPHTITGLVAAILAYYAARSGTWRTDAGK